MTVLKLPCPHCGNRHEDLLEVLDPDKIDSMHCEECRRQLWFSIMECHRCANEQVFTWAHEPEVHALDMLTCEACGSPFRRQDGPDE
ncbi:MAG: hypothetical protein H0X13_14200 [Ramlibacter sp.]|nr:hypothetical protein [Ramlibacter sp.]